jgi:hypothetical protein
MSPTPDEGDPLLVVLRGSPFENVVDVMRVALEEALETAEELFDEVLRVPLGVGEEQSVSTTAVKKCAFLQACRCPFGLFSG